MACRGSAGQSRDADVVDRGAGLTTAFPAAVLRLLLPFSSSPSFFSSPSSPSSSDLAAVAADWEKNPWLGFKGRLWRVL